MRRALVSVVPLVPAMALAVAVAAPASATEQPDTARGTVKIEDTVIGDADNPNEVKVGCDFSLEFFGMEEGTVPVTFTLQPPSGDEVIAEDEAQVVEGRGNEHSGSLAVDLADELADVPPAQAEDFDHKVRVDAVVKSSEGNDEITKTAMLFILCEEEPVAVAGEEATVTEEEPVAAEVAGVDEVVPVGGVAAGEGGTADGALPSAPILLGGLGLLGAGLARAYRRRRQLGA